jgi:hypothetical protein
MSDFIVEIKETKGNDMTNVYTEENTEELVPADQADAAIAEAVAKALDGEPVSDEETDEESDEKQVF